MGLLRLLLLVLVGWWLGRLLRRHLSAPDGKPREDPHYLPMRRCTACGVHTPADSLSADGRCPRCRNAP